MLLSQDLLARHMIVQFSFKFIDLGGGLLELVERFTLRPLSRLERCQ